jgi:PST family polysaccharide transporter
MWTIFRKEFIGFKMSAIDMEEGKRLLAGAWPLAVAGLSVMLYMRIDQVMLGQILGDSAVGIFSAAVRISECWYFVPMAVLAAISPTLTASYRDAGIDYQQKLLVFIRLMLILSVAVAAIFTALAKPIIVFLYGNHYEGAAAVLAIHAWSGIFASLGVASGPWFLNSGMTKTRMVHTLLGALANIGLNSYMIPRFGPVGSAFSTLVSYSLAGFWLNGLSSHTWPIFRLQLRAVFPSIGK